MLLDSLKELLTNPGVIIVGVMSCIELIPIKINPWSWILSLLRNALYGDLRKEIQDVKMELTETKVQNWRWNVLDFANSCRNNRRHSHDEWRHTISQLAEYEAYVERNEITNGVFEEDARYLREEYQKHCTNNDFL